MKDEVLEILVAGGAREPIRVEQDTHGWLVSAWFGETQHAGHTGIDPLTSDDPRDMARRLVVIAKKSAEEPAAEVE